MFLYYNDNGVESSFLNFRLDKLPIKGLSVILQDESSESDNERCFQINTSHSSCWGRLLSSFYFSFEACKLLPKVVNALEFCGLWLFS